MARPRRGLEVPYDTVTKQDGGDPTQSTSEWMDIMADELRPLRGLDKTVATATSGLNDKIDANTASIDALEALPPVAGVASGYKMARGIALVVGSATVVTGLASVVAVIATIQEDLVVTSHMWVTADIGDQAGSPAAGSFLLKKWKPTATNNVTPIAGTATHNINWIAIGT